MVLADDGKPLYLAIFKPAGSIHVTVAPIVPKTCASESFSDFQVAKLPWKTSVTSRALP